MAVIAINEQYRAQTGSRKSSGERTYTVSWQVETNDVEDGPDTIVNSVMVPTLGSSLSFGNDTDTDVYLTDLTPRRVAGNRNLWILTGNYKTPDKPDDEGNETTDPTNRADEVSYDTAHYTRPVVRAKSLTKVEGSEFSFPGRRYGSLGPVTNSAGVPFDPPIEEDAIRYVLRVIKSLEDYPSSVGRSHQNAVNSRRIRWSFPGHRITVPALHGKVAGIVGTLTRENGFTYWKVNYEVHIDYVHNWRTDVLDLGVMASARAGDPDGNGGYISPGDQVDGAPPVRPLTDSVGNPITQPVLFNGQGQPLAEGEDPVYLTYGHYPELPFSALDLDD